MKHLEDFRLVREFLSSQGIQPTFAMVALDQDAWHDLVLLAGEWRAEMETAAEAEAAAKAAMLPDEMEIEEKAKQARAQLERERLLFHSSGHRPGVDNVRG